MMKQVTTTIALIVIIALHSFSFINAMNTQCRLKYFGNLVIEDQTSTLIGIATSSNLLGRVPYTVADGSMYRPVQFQFVECIVEGYSCHPEEYGFLIAQPVNPKYCATAFKVEGHMPKKYSINHHTCNYDGSDMDLMNRQLVKAQYIPPEGSKSYGAKVLITFEGSPNKQTSTGFNNQHAFFHPLGQPYSQNGAVIISNDTDSPKLALTEVQIHKTTSMVPGKKTTNEDGFEKFFAWAFHMDFSSESFDKFFHKQQSQSNS